MENKEVNKERAMKTCLEKIIPGLSNVRPAGHMRPAKHPNVAREYVFS